MGGSRTHICGNTFATMQRKRSLPQFLFIQWSVPLNGATFSMIFVCIVMGTEGNTNKTVQLAADFPDLAGGPKDNRKNQSFT